MFLNDLREVAIGANIMRYNFEIYHKTFVFKIVQTKKGYYDTHVLTFKDVSEFIYLNIQNIKFDKNIRYLNIEDLGPINAFYDKKEYEDLWMNIYDIKYNFYLKLIDRYILINASQIELDDSTYKI